MPVDKDAIAFGCQAGSEASTGESTLGLIGTWKYEYFYVVSSVDPSAAVE